jgi:cytochrome b subunit of formate dehydrogenase
MNEIIEGPMTNSAPTLWQVFKSVIASFFGVQKEEVRQRDFTHGKPSQFIIVGLVLTIAFILGVLLLVKLVLFFALPQ